MRKSVHNASNKEKDLGGLNSLLSNQFYYFGENTHPIPKYLKGIIKKNQGHLRIENQEIIKNFEHWIQQFEQNKIFGDSQLKHEFDRMPSNKQLIRCSARDLEDDEYEREEKIC